MPNVTAEKETPVTILDGVVFDLRSAFAIAPPPAATKKDADEDEVEEDEDDEESGDNSNESDESDSDSDESDEDDDEDEDEKAKTATLIKALREENKSRRLLIRKLRAEIDTLKKSKAPVKKASVKADEEEDEDDGDKPLTDREKGLMVRLAVTEGLAEYKLNPTKRKAIERLIDPDDIDIEDGEVVGLKEALEEIAQDYPEWVLDDDSDNGNGRSASGASTNRKKKTSGSGLDKKTLEGKYPALRSR